MQDERAVVLGTTDLHIRPIRSSKDVKSALRPRRVDLSSTAQFEVT